MLTRAGWRGEWLIERRHPLLWIVAAGGIAFIALAAGNEAPRNQRELFEALLRLNLFIPAFVLPFVAGALAPVFFLREAEHGMSDLFAAYPQTPRAWLAVRLGSFAALLIGICTAQQAVIVAILALGYPSQLAALASQTAGLMAWVHLPACLIWGYILARVSCAAGKASMVYLAAAFGWLAYTGLATLTATPLIAGSFVAWEPLRTAMLLADPYAITALVNPPPLAGLSASREIAIVLGRIGWLGLCYLLVRGIERIPALTPAREGKLEQPARRFPLAVMHASTPGFLMLQLRWIVFDKFFLLALAGWVLLVFPELFSGMNYVEQLSVLAPDSRDALNRVMWDLVPPMGVLVLLYAADRVSRMTSVTGMADLVAATPYASWRFLAAQLTCLWLVALALLGFTLLVVLAAQIAVQSPVQPGEYLEQAGQAMPELLLSAILFVALHGALRSRMVANLTGFALFVLGHSSLAPAMGLINPLWKPLAIPLAVPDHVLGLEANWATLLTFGSFWAAICGAALVVAVRFHHRGLPYRQSFFRKALFHPAALGAAVMLAGGAWQGLAIHRALAADFALTSADDRARSKADYERRYAHWQNRPQPQISSVRSEVAFAGDGHSVDLSVAMELVNRTARPIDRILVGRNQIDVAGDVAIDGAVAEKRDEATGQIVFRLARAMQAGDVRNLRFAARITQSAYSGTEGLLILRRQFASVPAFLVMPAIGFRREFTLRDPVRRRQFGLPPLAIAAPSRLDAGETHLSAYQARLETVVSVPSGQSGVAPGELIRKWSAGGRDHFRFRTDRAIRNLPMFQAVPWVPQQWQVGSLTAEIYAPGTIPANDPNLLGVRDTLAWLGHDVAPYPGKTLRLIAAPEVGPSGFAVPQTMLVSHRRGFRARPAPDAGFNQAYRRAVHETAHQWFGHLLGYGIPEERAFLVESLAKYAELVMVERRYGAKAMRAIVAWEADRLAHARLVPAEAATPLIDAEDSEDMYSRATLAFACLRERLGDRTINSALHDIAASSLETGRPARSLDFVAALKRTGGKANQPVIDRLLLGSLPIETALAKSGCTIG